MDLQTFPVESNRENKLVINTNAVPAAPAPLSVVDPLESVDREISTPIESGGFSTVENHDGDVPPDTAIAEKTVDPVVELVFFAGSASEVNDANVDVITSSSLSDEEEDSILKVIEDLFGEEASELDSGRATPSPLGLYKASLHTSLPPVVSSAETERDPNERARSGSPSHHSIRSTPPCNRSASIRSIPPPPRASSHDRHSTWSILPRGPSPHPQPATIEEKRSPATRLSPPFKTPVQTATSPVIPTSRIEL
ncbi:hypothetical protein DFS33DRAFT_189740 [Desarmillaria ectypa]|nr:hypothetical protein DFS33DRAFT_189740 [Desarmillaria ectypa]